MIPFHKPTGAKITARDFNGILSAVRGAKSVVGGSGVGTYATDSGQVITVDGVAYQSSDLILCKYDGTNFPPLYGVGEMYDSVPSDPGLPPIVKVRPPYSPGFSRLCVFIEQAMQESGGIVLAAKSGGVKVRYTGTVTVGDRLDGTKDGWIAQSNPLGPMLVRSVYATEMDGTTLAFVELNGQRGDTKIVVAPDGTAYAAKTIIWGDGFAVSNAVPGNPLVSVT